MTKLSLKTAIKKKVEDVFLFLELIII